MNTISEQYSEAIQNKFDARDELRTLRGENPGLGHDFTVEKGKKYDRIVMTSRYASKSRSVHAFVERSTGQLIKAASWAAPAKKSDGTLQSRFDLSTPEGFREAVYNADWAGSYLYADYDIRKVAE